MRSSATGSTMHLSDIHVVTRRVTKLICKEVASCKVATKSRLTSHTKLKTDTACIQGAPISFLELCVYHTGICVRQCSVLRSESHEGTVQVPTRISSHRPYRSLRLVYHYKIPYHSTNYSSMRYQLRI